MSYLSALFSAQTFQDTFKRFPLSCVCAVLLFFLIVSENHNWDFMDDKIEGRLAVISAAGFFIFGLFGLLKESLHFSYLKQYALSFIAMGGLGALVFLTDQYEKHMLFIFPALLLLIMSAPFIFRQSTDTAFWHFNAVLWVNAKIGVVTALILGGGASAALAAIDFLFHVDISYRFYSDAWIFACTLFAPFYVFSQIPKDFNATVAIPAYEKILKFIVSWLCVPLVLIYMVILYVYYLKILFEWELPQGQLAAITTGFGGAGVCVYLVSWPFRETGSYLTRALHKYLFPALILPTLMMCISIGVRLNEYGVTEERYMIGMTALWFAIIILLFVFRYQNLKFIPLILGAFLLIASFGPWGAVSLSGYSQHQRLEKLFVKYGMLQEGFLVPLKGEINFADEKSINSIFRYFERRKELETIKEDFPLKEGAWIAKDYPYAMVEKIGLDHISEYMTEKRREELGQRISYHSNNYNDGRVYQSIQGYDHYYYIHSLNENEISIPKKKGAGSLETPVLDISLEENIIGIEFEDSETLKVDLGTYSQEVNYFKKLNRNDETPYILEVENNDLQARLFFLNVSGNIKNKKVNINHAGFILFLKEK